MINSAIKSFTAPPKVLQKSFRAPPKVPPKDLSKVLPKKLLLHQKTLLFPSAQTGDILVVVWLKGKLRRKEMLDLIAH